MIAFVIAVFFAAGTLFGWWLGYSQCEIEKNLERIDEAFNRIEAKFRG